MNAPYLSSPVYAISMLWLPAAIAGMLTVVVPFAEVIDLTSPSTLTVILPVAFSGNGIVTVPSLPEVNSGIVISAAEHFL